MKINLPKLISTGKTQFRKICGFWKATGIGRKILPHEQIVTFHWTRAGHLLLSRRIKVRAVII